MREKVSRWQEYYNLMRPHSALQDQAPASCATAWSAAAQTPPEARELLENPYGSYANSATPLRYQIDNAQANSSTPNWLDFAGLAEEVTR